MKWSLKLGTVAGIAIYLHWTFALLVGWIFIAHLGTGKGMGDALNGVGFVLALFGCVVLHELGHALTAKRYGVRTRDIILLPIGGIARLERMPEKPMQEFWVALAGPAVNVVIALALWGILLAVGSVQTVDMTELLEQNVVARLMAVNVFLALFNMLPAFPMDGGRVLRALLATRLGRRRATAIAANIGQAMAILFGIVGFLYNPFLIFIAIFVYLGAQAEAEMVETHSLIEGLLVKDAMMTRFRTLSESDRLSAAVSELLAGSQQDFPVLTDGEVSGLLRRHDLIRALAEGRRESTIGQAMTRDCPSVNAEAPLERTLETMRRDGCVTLPVLDGRRLVGLLTLENISELVMIRSTGAGSRPVPGRSPFE